MQRPAVSRRCMEVLCALALLPLCSAGCRFLAGYDPAASAGDADVQPRDIQPPIDIFITDTPTFLPGQGTLLLQLEVDATGALSFDPAVVKSGLPLRWEFADGTSLIAKSFERSFADFPGTAVGVYAYDDVASIEEISFYRDGLVGPIPKGLGTLEQLRVLNLAKNGLNSANLEDLTALSRIEVLRLDGNPLNVPFPTTLLALERLTSLSIAQTALSGQIPREIAALKELQQLDLSNNALTGAIPAELGDLIALVVLDLSFNEFTSCEPGALGGLRDLRFLSLSNLGLDTPSVTAIVDEIFANRESYRYAGNKVLQLNKNGAPTAAACQKLVTLGAKFAWTVHVDGCDG